METPLVRELLEMKQEIIRQMAITDRLTSQSKGSRKSYLEVENASIIKQRKIKEEQKHNVELRLDDGKDDSTIDADLINEVTIVSDIHDDDDETNHNDEDDSRKVKGNKIKNKKNDEGIFHILLCILCVC